MHKQILILFIYLFSFNIFCQNTTENEAQKLNEDLNYLKKALYTSHPAIFKYISEDSLNYLFDSLRFKNDEIATKLELEKKVRFILSEIGCIHTSLKNSVFESNKTYIPFKTYANENGLWIEKDYADSLSIAKDYRILAINGHTTNSILTKMKEYRASDGYNESFKYGLINQEKWFNNVYQFYFDSDIIRTYKLVSKDLDTIIIKRKNSRNTPKIEDLNTVQNTNYGKNISVEFDSINRLAILKIKSFNGSPVFGKMINKSRYKNALKLIMKKGYTNLVIDLRNNTGGDAASGYSLLSFFVQENHPIIIKKHKGKIFKYAIPSSKVGSIFNFFVGNLFASRIPTFKARVSKAKVRKNRKHNFEGSLFVITNGFTLSTASNVASLFKYKTNAALIGTETGGGENNLNAYFFPKIKLLYSKIEIQIPQYKIDLRLTKNKGSGVIPNVPISYFVQDILSKKDLEIKKIIEMISAKQTL
jgi:hypothetical protein